MWAIGDPTAAIALLQDALLYAALVWMSYTRAAAKADGVEARGSLAAQRARRGTRRSDTRGSQARGSQARGSQARGSQARGSASARSPSAALEMQPSALPSTLSEGACDLPVDAEKSALPSGALPSGAQPCKAPPCEAPSSFSEASCNSVSTPSQPAPPPSHDAFAISTELGGVLRVAWRSSYFGALLLIAWPLLAPCATTAMMLVVGAAAMLHAPRWRGFPKPSDGPVHERVGVLAMCGIRGVVWLPTTFILSLCWVSAQFVMAFLCTLLEPARAAGSPLVAAARIGVACSAPLPGLGIGVGLREWKGLLDLRTATAFVVQLVMCSLLGFCCRAHIRATCRLRQLAEMPFAPSAAASITAAALRAAEKEAEPEADLDLPKRGHPSRLARARKANAAKGRAPLAAPEAGAPEAGAPVLPASSTSSVATRSAPSSAPEPETMSTREEAQCGMLGECSASTLPRPSGASARPSERARPSGAARTSARASARASTRAAVAAPPPGEAPAATGHDRRLSVGYFFRLGWGSSGDIFGADQPAAPVEGSKPPNALTRCVAALIQQLRVTASFLFEMWVMYVRTTMTAVLTLLAGVSECSIMRFGWLLLFLGSHVDFMQSPSRRQAWQLLAATYGALTACAATLWVSFSPMIVFAASPPSAERGGWDDWWRVVGLHAGANNVSLSGLDLGWRNIAWSLLLLLCYTLERSNIGWRLGARRHWKLARRAHLPNLVKEMEAHGGE